MLERIAAKTVANIEALKSRREEGVTAIEYGLIAALIAVVIIGIVTLVGGSLANTFSSVEAGLEDGLGG